MPFPFGKSQKSPAEIVKSLKENVAYLEKLEPSESKKCEKVSPFLCQKISMWPVTESGKTHCFAGRLQRKYQKTLLHWKRCSVALETRSLRLRQWLNWLKSSTTPTSSFPSLQTYRRLILRCISLLWKCLKYNYFCLAVRYIALH